MSNPITASLPGNASLQGRDRVGQFSAVGAGAVRYRPAPGARINYAPNPSFESTNLQNYWWSCSPGSSIARIAGGTHGSYAGHITCDGVTTQYGGASVGPVYWKPLAGKSLWCSFKWRGTGVIPFLLFRVWDTDSASYSSSDGLVNGGALVPPVDWERAVIGPIVMPGAPDFVQLLFCQSADQTGLHAFDLEVDELMMTTEDPIDWEFFDGVTLDPITGMLGTPNATAHPLVQRAAFWIEEGTTNIWINPSAEVNTTGVFTDGGASVALTRDTTRAYVGDACFKHERLVLAGGPSNLYPVSQDGVMGETFTVQARLMRSSAQPLYAQLRLYCFTAALGFVALNASPNYALSTTEWEHFEFTSAVPPVGTIAKILPLVVFFGDLLESNPAVGAIGYADAIQCEKKTLATSYTDGSLGPGYAPVGVLHASASVRTGASISLDQAGRISPLSGALIFQYVRDRDTGAAELILDCGDGTSAKDRLRIRTNASDKLEMSWQSNGGSEQLVASTQSMTTAQLRTVHLAWAGTNTWVGIDGGPLVAGTRDAPQLDWGSADLVLSAPTGSYGLANLTVYDQPLEPGYRAMAEAEIAAGGANIWSLLESEGSLTGTLALEEALTGIMSLEPVLTGELAALPAGGG